MMRYQKGVTLMELMIVVAIVGILAGIAYPSYRAQVLRSHRSDAKIALERTAQTLERCYTNSAPKSYGACPAPPATSDNGYFAVGLAVPAANRFVITATAVASQLGDTDCRTFTLDNINFRDAQTSTGVANAAVRAACWGR